MDRLDAMQLFVRVVELGSFSAVAQQMGVARSVVTRQIAALEAHLGAKLLARSTRRLSLTSAGTAYLEKCRVILNLVEAAETGIAEERQTPRGPIRVGAPLSYGLKRLSPLLLDFAEHYPEVMLDIDYNDRRVNLIEEGMDLAIRVTTKLDPATVARRIGTSRLIAVASPDYLARHGTPATPEDLANHACLGYTAVAAHPSWTFTTPEGRTVTVPLRSPLTASNGDVLTEAAARGMGLTCQPDFILDPWLADGRLLPVLTDCATPELGVYAVLPGNRHVPHRVRVLMDWLAERLMA
ncbi:MAG: LysR family transcriptional regulator [Methyloversatilis sp.]|uniref:LysR family transcriptional regulator n=1 Tax=Methyloversatilis sp. TaxID=2569862 RepID=UPI0025FFACA2|nr:LysR family transcriptional regulator [Methyloversatilis sp.]MCR6665080.1 LysR family transcriptional regulator [Methyloversatilis sp.]